MGGSRTEEKHETLVIQKALYIGIYCCIVQRQILRGGPTGACRLKLARNPLIWNQPLVNLFHVLRIGGNPKFSKKISHILPISTNKMHDMHPKFTSLASLKSPLFSTHPRTKSNSTQIKLLEKMQNLPIEKNPVKNLPFLLVGKSQIFFTGN